MLVLDTHTVLWWTLAPEKLSSDAHNACSRMKQTKGYMSSISIWEIGIKLKRGKLDIGTSLNDYVSRLSKLSYLEILPVDTQIWMEDIALRWDHRDPADRTVVATAKIRGLPIVTKDKAITEFYPHIIW